MTKTFNQVVCNIVAGEEWVNTNKNSNLKKIKCDNYGNVELSMKNTGKYLIFNPNEEFKLLKKVSFVEAMKSYNEGKEIQSALSGNKYLLKDNMHCVERIASNVYVSGGSMNINEINNLWYINE